MSAPFPDVLGHDDAREGLWCALSEDRLHHATLIQGLQGVGKRTLAEAVARALLCENPRQGACGACSHCRRSVANIHPDLVMIGRDDILGIDEELGAHAEDRASKRKERVGRLIDVEYMRLLGGWLTRRAWEARRRVAVVVDAERMNVQGANAFLKSLEEPAQGAVVLMTSSSPSFLRPTIRSRCASVRLSGVPQALIEKRLAGEGVEPVEARRRALSSGGSLSRALRGAPPLEELKDQLLRVLAGGKDAELASYVAASTASGVDTDRDTTLHLLATLLRDIAVLRSGGSKQDLLHPDAFERLARAAARSFDPFPLFGKVIESRERVAGNANRLALWDDLLHGATSGS